MELRKGTWRFVVLYKGMAIKIARIRLLRFFVRILAWPFFGHRWKTPMKESLWGYIWLGIVSNKEEYFYYQTNQDPDVVPSRLLLLWGLVVVQDRGDQVSLQDLKEKCRLHKHIGDDNPKDIKEASCQYVRLSNGDICLADYGLWETTVWLKATLGKRQQLLQSS